MSQRYLEINALSKKESYRCTSSVGLANRDKCNGLKGADRFFDWLEPAKKFRSHQEHLTRAGFVRESPCSLDRSKSRINGSSVSLPVTFPRNRLAVSSWETGA